MTLPLPYMPGVPAAGHIAVNGFWHPGAVNGCRKPPCRPHEPAWVAAVTAVGPGSYRAVLRRGREERRCEHVHKHHDTALRCARGWARDLNGGT